MSSFWHGWGFAQTPSVVGCFGRLSRCGLVLLVVGAASVDDVAVAVEVLVADRLTDRVLRYNDAGEFLGVLIENDENLQEPNGMALSPDSNYLYVASRKNSKIIRYDYDGESATNGTVLVEQDLATPASIEFSANGTKMYVSNLGNPQTFDGNTVGQFLLDGSSAGSPITGGDPTGRTGMTLGPEGQLYVASFQDGAILRLNNLTNTLEPFIDPNPALLFAGNLLVDGNHLYAVGGLSGTVLRFNATTGEPDPSFTPVMGLAFPASLALHPSGDGLLVGVLGFQNGTGNIQHYGFDGGLVGTFAENSSDDPEQGFAEATGLLVSPPLRNTIRCGDADLDLDVDTADLSDFLANWTGADPDPEGVFVTYAGGDCDLDGDIDSADMNDFFFYFTGAGPQQAGRGELAAVPEPSSLGLGLLAVVMALGPVRVRARSRRQTS